MVSLVRPYTSVTSVNVCCICVFTSVARTVVPSLPQSLLWWEYHLQGGCALVSGWPLQVCRQCHDTVNIGVVASFLVACTQANLVMCRELLMSNMSLFLGLNRRLKSSVPPLVGV